MADANNISVNDANGVPHQFGTLYDSTSNTHRTHIMAHVQVTNTDISNTNQLPVMAVLANGIPVNAGANGLPTNITDGVSTNKATVAAFHSADNQQPGGTAFGLLTGGVAQAVNIVGNLDRQRETSFDNIPAVGIITGTAQLASPILVTNVISGAITGNATSGNTQFVNCVTSFTQRAGIVQSFTNGSIAVVDLGNANQEYIFINVANSTGVNAQFMKGHAANVLIQGFSYSQARDSAGPDGQVPIGMPAGTVWLWNGAANTGLGGVEIERSAAGELDGASGNGTNIAAEYEWNGGGPANSSGKATGFQFDRARSIQGKANVNFTITTTTAAMPNITFSVAANTNLLQPGQKVTLSGNASSGPETVLVSATFVPGSGNSALLQSPVVNPGQTTAQWDVYGVTGPGLKGFYPDGVGIEEEALYDPITNLFYLERSATSDNAAPQNVVVENPGLLNGSGNIDRMRNNLDSTANLITFTTANSTTAITQSSNQTNFNHRGAIFYLAITAVAGTSANVQLTVNNIDPVSGKFFPVFTGPATTTNVAQNVMYQVYPGLTGANNSGLLLGRTWCANITVTGTGTNTVTGSLTATMIL